METTSKFQSIQWIQHCKTQGSNMRILNPYLHFKNFTDLKFSDHGFWFESFFEFGLLTFLIEFEFKLIEFVLSPIILFM